MVRFYTFKCDWIWEDWQTGEEAERTSQGVVAAQSYGEAVEKITNRLPYVSNLFINEYSDVDFIFLSNDNYTTLCEKEWGLDDPEEESDETW